MESKLLIYTIALLLAAKPAQSQSSLSFSTNASNKIENTFNFEVHPNLEKKILRISGEKMEFKANQITFNDHPLEVKSCKTRGNTTLQFRRKSFSLSLMDPIALPQVQVIKLAINNLAMDENYWRARLSFLLMKTVGIFPLSNQYTELRLNGQTQGIYLMIQKPEDYCLSLGINLLVRRASGGRIEVEYSNGIEAKKIVKVLKSCRTLNKTLEGTQLSDSLNQIINLEQYYQWLAFNYLISNGDYYDELFLFLDPETNKFGIIPWDYDDVFATQPHEGLEKRNHALGDRLIYSSEASLDRAIGKDDYLYSNYLKTFLDVVNILSPEVLKEAFEQIYQELYPFFMEPPIIAQSKYDQSGLTNINRLQDDLNNHYQFIIRRQSTVKTTIALDLQLITQ